MLGYEKIIFDFFDFSKEMSNIIRNSTSHVFKCALYYSLINKILEIQMYLFIFSDLEIYFT